MFDNHPIEKSGFSFQRSQTARVQSRPFSTCSLPSKRSVDIRRARSRFREAQGDSHMLFFDGIQTVAKDDFAISDHGYPIGNAFDLA